MNLLKPNSDYLERKSGYSCRGRSHASMNLFLRREETGVCTRIKPG